MMRGSRGQTMIEMVIMLPLVLLVLFGIIYVARMGVVNERTELALRYGGITAFNSSSNVYSAANIYANINVVSVPGPCPTAPSGIYADASPFPSPTSGPFWQPDPNATPSSSCSQSLTSMGGASFLSSHFFLATSVTASAGVDAPAYLHAVQGQAATNVASSSGSFVHAAYPGMIMYCISTVNTRVSNAISGGGSNTLPTPMPTVAPSASPLPISGSC